MSTALAAHSPSDLSGILRVVDLLYAAACAETSWDRAVEELHRAGGFGACALTSVDPLQRRATLWASYGLKEPTARDRRDGGVPLNPLLTDNVLRSPPGAVWHDRRIISATPPATTSFWTQWMEASGLTSWICVIAGKDGHEVVCLEVFLRPAGGMSHHAAVDLLTQLAPHLTRAWRLGRLAQATPPHGAAPLATPPIGVTGGAASPEVTRMAALRSAFGLSKAEARLALYLAAGASLPSMAEAFDVKLTTIRSQLQQAFSKTGTSRQAELVALLLKRGYVDPIEPAQEAAGHRFSCPRCALEPAN